HTHTSGTGGAPRYGNLLVTPLVGVPLRTGFLPERQKNEHAAAGYYQITLQRRTGDVDVSLTASRKVGYHRYRFYTHQKETVIPATIMLDVSHTLSRMNKDQRSTVCTGAEATMVGNQGMQGKASFRGGWGSEAPYTIYFYAVFSKPFARSGSWQQDTVLSESKQASGTAIGLYAGFDARQGETIDLKLAISYRSIEQAKTNLDEIPGWDFELARKNAFNAWEQHLSVVQVKGGSAEQRKMFYSALRNTMIMPADLTGENPGWASGKAHYWDHYCLWDVFRSTMPLHSLLYPQRQAAIVNSLLDIYDHRGWLPDAWIAGHYANNQGGTNADVVLADAAVKNLPGINWHKAFEAARKNATQQSDSPTMKGRFLEEYNRLGYLTRNSYKGAVSRTMEYAYNDFCIAQLADKVGERAEANSYRQRAANVFRLFNDSVGYFWARDARGQWEPEFTLHSKLAAVWDDPYFYEGGSEVYSYYVPHDMAGLIKRHGGAQAFAQRLDAFFDSGRFKLENEPLFLVPYSYNYAGMPFKTAERVRHILTHAFRPGHEGLPGQDDSGAMSSWFAFSAMGFFPVAGQPLYLLGSPLFEEISIRLPKGKKWVVRARGNSAKNIYIQKATLNGKPLNRSWITHQEVVNGGVLELVMGPAPSAWGQTQLPYSMTTAGR
ncbi:MAG: GH92 family glycosyl hydrolase, partial [Chitinophagaceae bacterium]|nr:GH92 family glycosyl hydrolase [Chitinophagaceae bacterium]